MGLLQNAQLPSFRASAYAGVGIRLKRQENGLPQPLAGLRNDEGGHLKQTR